MVWGRGQGLGTAVWVADIGFEGVGTAAAAAARMMKENVKKKEKKKEKGRGKASLRFEKDQ